MRTFTTIAAFILSLLATFVVAAPIVARDVWVPPIISPKAGTVWKVGKTYEVTWNTGTKPDQVTNPNGKVFLSKDGLLDIDHPLATGFLLTDGKVAVTIPKGTAPDDQYAVVLFGDSGNASHNFTIKK